MLTFDVNPALLYLNGVLYRLAHPEPALAVIGARAREEAMRRIQRSKVDPEGSPWAPWSDSTREHREHKGNAAQGLLWDDGTLLDSIEMHVSDDEVTVGSEVEHAGYVQEGTDRMPARPFLGWTDDDLVRATDTLLHYIEGAL